MSNDQSQQDFLNKMFLTGNIRNQNGQLLLMGRPGLIISSSIFTSVMGKLLQYNKEEVYTAGYNSMDAIIKDYKKRFDNSPNKMIDFSIDVISSSGFGKPKIMMEKEDIIISLNPSTIPESYLSLFGKSDMPVCFFISGAFEKLFNLAFDKKYKVEEIYCKAKGDNECKFVAKIC